MKIHYVYFINLTIANLTVRRQALRAARLCIESSGADAHAVIWDRRHATRVTTLAVTSSLNVRYTKAAPFLSRKVCQDVSEETSYIPSDIATSPHRITLQLDCLREF